MAKERSTPAPEHRSLIDVLKDELRKKLAEGNTKELPDRVVEESEFESHSSFGVGSEESAIIQAS